jgi:hypothetical protein
MAASWAAQRPKFYQRTRAGLVWPPDDRIYGDNRRDSTQSSAKRLSMQGKLH